MFINELFPSYSEIVGDWVRAVGAGTVPPPHVDQSPAQQTSSVALTPSDAVIRTWPTSAPDRLRQGLLLVAGVLFLPWALYWGLLLP